MAVLGGSLEAAWSLLLVADVCRLATYWEEGNGGGAEALHTLASAPCFAMIDLEELKSMMQDRLRTSGPDFDKVFYKAVNWVINDLRLRTLLTPSKISESNPPDQIDIDEKYIGVFYEGVPFYMRRLAKWASIDKDDYSEIEYEKQLRLAYGQSIEDEDPPTGWRYE